MIFVPSVASDIERYYRDTYVKFNGFGERLFYIDSVTPECVTGTDENGDEFCMNLHEEEPFLVDFVLPRRKVFQLGRQAALLHRIPARQYKRGISSNNTQISYVGLNSFADVCFSNLTKFVTKQPYGKLVDAFTSENYSIALNERFSVVIGSGSIFVDLVCVGKLLKGNKAVRVTNPLFTNELTKLAVESGLEVKQ